MLVAKWFLRAGLAFVFIYASLEISFNPAGFLKYIPSFVEDIAPASLFLPAFSAAEIILSIWLLSGWRARYAAFAAFAMITGIVVFNLDYIAVLFRNVAISFAALALAELEGVTVYTSTSDQTKKTEVGTITGP